MDEDMDTSEKTAAQQKIIEDLNAVLMEDDFASAAMCSASATGVSFSTAGVSVPASAAGVSYTSKLEQFSRIETALALNKLTDEKLTRLENILNERLIECRQKMKDLQNVDNYNDRREKSAFKYINCGKPYFKDKKCFSAPDNEDTKLMQKAGMYDFSCIVSVPGWTVKDKSEFITLIHHMSKEIRSKELHSKISQLKRDAKSIKISKSKEISKIKVEISSLSKKSLKELALPNGEDYDWDLIANKLKCRHSPQEYSSLWSLFLHPSINKNCWTKAEHIDLQKIADNNYLQDWDLIAHELNTNRTGYQCFVYFRTNMSNSFTNQKWTKEEEEYLKRIIDYYREDEYIPWGRVAAAMENRTKIQIYNKYLRLIEMRKGRFLPEEDSVILNCVELYGTDFKKIQTFLPGRSAIQLRNRHNVLNKTRLSTVWSETEDRNLLQLMANQDSSINYASISKHFPGKDRIKIRARYLTLMKWVQRNPNVDITHAPRRGARRLCHGQAATDLTKAVERLKHRMQTEVEHKKSKRITRNSTQEELDEALVAFMVTERIKDMERSSSPDMSEIVIPSDDKATVAKGDLSSTNLRKLLILLKAKLNKDQFELSSYNENYSDLAKQDKEVCLVKVRSYSKKDVVNTISIEKPPDIWGETLSGPLEYVLPPNLVTIIGCRTLITLTNAKHTNLVDINYIKRKNVILKEEIYRLMERFNTLFLWPMLLSNEGPNENKAHSPLNLLNMGNQRAFKRSLMFDDSSDEDDNGDGGDSATN